MVTSGTDPLQVVRSAESKIATRKTEKAIAVNQDGEIIFEKVGGKSSVSFTNEEVAKFTGNIVTHNHPSGSSFSWADISLASRYDMAEMRAVGREYEHSMKPGESGWPAISDLKATFEDADRQVRDKNWVAIAAGEMTIDEANKNHWHEVWTIVSRALDLKYTRLAR